MPTQAIVRRVFPSLPGGLIGLLACAAAVSSETRVADAFTTPLTALDGNTVRIAELRGDRPVYVKFWASWCGTCMEELPHFQQASREYSDTIDFFYVNLGINDSLDDVRSFVAEHDLSMTTLVDSTGHLADTFGVMGTPWHTLADESLFLHMNGSADPEQVDERLAFLEDPVKAAAASRSRQGQVSLPEQPTVEPGPEPDTSPVLHYYLATWCDWYLEDRRPETAQRCVRSQRMINRLVERFPDLEVKGFASRLWTGEDELADYRSRRNVQHPLSIDVDNRAFLAHEVREIPTLLLVDDGNVLYRETGFDDFDALERALELIIIKSLRRLPPR